MSRLIDADLLIEGFKYFCQRNCDRCGYNTFLSDGENCDLINKQPTAFDTEKVILEIHDYFKKVIDNSKSDNIPLEVLTYNKDICEIVRKGGVNHVEPQCMPS